MGQPSSVINSFHYSAMDRRLRVTYVSGAVYDYLMVPVGVYRAMKMARSKGTFLNQEIKGYYAFEKVH